jgi:hypothetical protein
VLFALDGSRYVIGYDKARTAFEARQECLQLGGSPANLLTDDRLKSIV